MSESKGFGFSQITPFWADGGGGGDGGRISWLGPGPFPIAPRNEISRSGTSPHSDQNNCHTQTTLELYVYHGNLILVFFDIFYIKNSIPGSKTYLKMILRLVAPFSQSMSSFRATATHFMPETINFQRSPTTKHT